MLLSTNECLKTFLKLLYELLHQEMLVSPLFRVFQEVIWARRFYTLVYAKTLLDHSIKSFVSLEAIYCRYINSRNALYY